jgi:hypothetical protein
VGKGGHKGTHNMRSLAWRSVRAMGSATIDHAANVEDGVHDVESSVAQCVGYGARGGRPRRKG